MLPNFLSKREASFVTVIVALGLLVMAAGHKIKDLEAALAARPATEAHAEIKTNTTRTEGKIVVVRHYIPAECPAQVSAVPSQVAAGAPAGGAPASILVDERIETDPVVTSTVKERQDDHTSTPAGPAPARPWRYVGVLADPFAPSKLVGGRIGVTLYDRLDLGVGVRFWPRTETQAEVSYRF